MASIYTKEEFVKRSILVHGERYDYSDSIYINTRTKLKIICRIHGAFTQLARHHLHGRGCPQCAKNRRLNKNIFIERANVYHCNKYDYSLVDENIKSDQKIKVICPIHGIFEQRVDIHYHHGCPVCDDSKGEKRIREYLNTNNIQYIAEYSFPDCISKYPLRFDFAVFRNEALFCLVEYDGHFHFHDIFENNAIETQYRDNIKTSYCYERKIPLLRIKYTQYDNIENILREAL